MLIPLFDEDTGLLLIAGMVIYYSLILGFLTGGILFLFPYMFYFCH